MINCRRTFHRVLPAPLAALCAGFLACITSTFAQSTDWRPAALTVTGSKEQIWVVGVSDPRSGGLSEIRFWWCGPSTTTGKPPVPGASARLPPIDGNPRTIAADAESLQILYTNDTLWEYSPTRTGRMSAMWKTQCTEPPLAMAGDDSQPILWAIVNTSALPAPSSAPAEGADAAPSDRQFDDASQKVEKPSLPADPFVTPSTDAIPTTSKTLLRMRHGFWNRIATIPALDDAKSIWLAGRNERAYVFWDDGEGAIHFTEYVNGKWDGPERVASSEDVRCAWPGSTRTGPVFVAGIGGDIRTVNLHLVARNPQGQWHETGVVREGSDHLTVDGLRIGVGVAMERLALARIGPRDQVEFASADPSGSPIMHFNSLSTATPTLKDESSWETMLLPMLVLAFMTFILLSRREDVLRPAAVPMGFMLAPPWKRGVATMIDALPALFISSVLAVFFFPELSEMRDLNAMIARMQESNTYSQAFALNFTMMGLYSLWCLLWELGSGTTPGKRIFGCRVISADGSAPTARQIIYRNAARFVIMLLGIMGVLITFLTMVIMTRNCQRLGDVLARTIVIQPGVSKDIPVARPPKDPPEA